MSDGLYLRGTTWWARAIIDGKEYRFSTRTSDRRLAEQARLSWITARKSAHIDQEWRSLVTAWEDDSDSWIGRTYRHMRSKSRARGWPDVMHYEEFVALVLQSSGRCALTGLMFDTKSKGAHIPFSVSIDRIDSKLGYVAGNCRLVCLIANFAMRQWGEPALRKLALAYVAQLAAGIKTGTANGCPSVCD